MRRRLPKELVYDAFILGGALIGFISIIYPLDPFRSRAIKTKWDIHLLSLNEAIDLKWMQAIGAACLVAGGMLTNRDVTLVVTIAYYLLVIISAWCLFPGSEIPVTFDVDSVFFDITEQFMNVHFCFLLQCALFLLYLHEIAVSDSFSLNFFMIGILVQCGVGRDVSNQLKISFDEVPRFIGAFKDWQDIEGHSEDFQDAW